MFNIAATRFCLKEHSFEIYVSGCKGICKGCHNPELWDSSVGHPWKTFIDTIKSTLLNSGELVSSIRVYGGELLEKEKADILEFLQFISSLNKEIWVFTRFDFNVIDPDFLSYIDYIKCGPFREDLKEETPYYGVTLASSNQKIYKKGVDW